MSSDLNRLSHHTAGDKIGRAAFPAPDGTEIAYHVLGSGSDSAAPVICLPGGDASQRIPRRSRRPCRAPAADPAGPARHRRVRACCRLRLYRCDRQVGDVAALRGISVSSGWKLQAHSARGSLRSGTRQGMHADQRIRADRASTGPSASRCWPTPAGRSWRYAARALVPGGGDRVRGDRRRPRAERGPDRRDRDELQPLGCRGTRAPGSRGRAPQIRPRGSSTRRGVRPAATGPAWRKWTHRCCCSSATSTGSSPRCGWLPACSERPTRRSPAPATVRGWTTRPNSWPRGEISWLVKRPPIASTGFTRRRPLVKPATSGGACAPVRREKRIEPSLILPYRSLTTSWA